MYSLIDVDRGIVHHHVWLIPEENPLKVKLQKK